MCLLYSSKLVPKQSEIVITINMTKSDILTVVNWAEQGHEMDNLYTELDLEHQGSFCQGILTHHDWQKVFRRFFEMGLLHSGRVEVLQNLIRQP